ncbi:MAG: hypothetical protein NTX36_10215 [Proteobacteria bacterium]|nr:hypothetical protein [Pseudomonadota bacterium]
MPHEVKIKAYPGEKGGIVLQIHGLCDLGNCDLGNCLELGMERVAASHLAMDIEEVINTNVEYRMSNIE